MTNPAQQIADLQLYIDLQEAKAEFDQLVTEALLNEASTLMKLIGNRPGGEYLSKWMHVNHRLSANATYDRVTRKTGRIQWQQFKKDPGHFLILTTDKMSVGIKPNTGYHQSRSKTNSWYNPSSDNWLIYDVVAFLNDERIDNLLIPFPQRDDYDPGPEGQAEFKEEVARVTKLQKEKLNPDAPATQITLKRGGLPFGKDTRNPTNIFDKIKELGGKINEIYTVSGGTDLGNYTGSGLRDETTVRIPDTTGIEPGMSISGGGIASGATVVSVDTGSVEVSKPNATRFDDKTIQVEKLRRKRDVVATRKAAYGAATPGEVEKGITSWPTVPGVEAGKISRRRPSGDIEYSTILKRIVTFIPSIMRYTRTVLRRARVDREILDWFDDVRSDNEATRKMIADALATVIKSMSPEEKKSAASGDLKMLQTIIGNLRDTVAEMAKNKRV